MEPLVVDFLRNNSLASLARTYGVKTSVIPGESFFSLNYDQIESKPGLLVNQCRGLILGLSSGNLRSSQVSGDEPLGETVILARPFDRFFNHGDPNAASVLIDDPETIFYEKLDGTLCIVYFNTLQKQWHVATRSVPTANREISGWKEWTFRSLFEKALLDTAGLSFSKWTELLDHTKTYCFELTTPLNRVVVRYDDYRIHWLGWRDTQSGEEYAPDGRLGVPACPSHRISNLEELLTFVGSKGPMEQEGVVVRDKYFHRIKVKSLAYIAYNKVRDSTANSPRAVMELILSEKLDDVFAVLEPFVQTKALRIQEGLRLLLPKIDQMYEECLREAEEASKADGVDTNKRKYFALAVQKRKGWMPPLIDRFQGRCTEMSDFIAKKKDLSKNEWPAGFIDTLIEWSETTLADQTRSAQERVLEGSAVAP